MQAVIRRRWVHPWVMTKVGNTWLILPDGGVHERKEAAETLGEVAEKMQSGAGERAYEEALAQRDRDPAELLREASRPPRRPRPRGIVLFDHRGEIVGFVPTGR